MNWGESFPGELPRRLYLPPSICWANFICFFTERRKIGSLCLACLIMGGALRPLLSDGALTKMTMPILKNMGVHFFQIFRKTGYIFQIVEKNTSSSGIGGDRRVPPKASPTVFFANVLKTDSFFQNIWKQGPSISFKISSINVFKEPSVNKGRKLLGGALAGKQKNVILYGSISGRWKEMVTLLDLVLFFVINSKMCRQITGTPRRSIFRAVKFFQMPYTAN